MFRKRWVRRAFAGLVIGLAVTTVGLFVDRHLTRRAGEERHAAIVAHLDATDPRWRYDEIDADRGTLPDDQNGALLIPKFKAALADPPFDKDSRLGFDYLSAVPPNHVLADDTYGAIDGALGRNADALAVARQFNDYPRGLRRYVLAPNPIDTVLPDLQETRLVVRLLDLAAERSGRDGRGAAALGGVRPMVHAARSVDGEPTMISALVRMACLQIVARRVERTLGLARPTAQLAAVQDLLLREAETDLFWWGLRGDRAMMDRLFVNFRSGAIGLNRIAGKGPGSETLESGFGAWVLAPYLPGDHATFLEIVTRACEARALPDHEQRAALDRAELDVKNLPEGALASRLTRLFTPAFSKIHTAGLRARAVLRCAGVGLAVERFRQTHGRWPAVLDEIPKDLLPAVPPDPFDGEPLRYVKRDDGVTVYSIGPDEQDDGGLIRLGKATNDPGQDVGFRLYDPDRRGLPAVPRARAAGLLPPPVPGEIDDDFGPVAESGPEPREVGR